MDLLVAPCAQRNQVLLAVVTQPASRCSVVYLEINYASAVLTSPSVPLQDLLTKPSVRFGSEPQSRASLSK